MLLHHIVSFFIVFHIFYLKIQVISTSPQDSKIIQQYGADRIQLVSALQIGGITPPRALIRKSLEVSDIKSMVMVRHHNQGFVLQKEEKDLLVQQALSLVDFGCKGIVVGANTYSNKVDQQFLTSLSKEISFNKIDVTFHKASDYTSNLSQTYETLLYYGVSRVLTQGGRKKVQENVDVLREVLSKQEIKTLIGGGISFKNIEWLIKQLNPQEVHIGTCVRKDKYGPVQGDLIQKFIQKMMSI